MLTVHGLKNCDTCRKALKWLDEREIAYQFVDVRKDGVEEADISRWVKAVGWETLLNKRGTTWRGLDDTEKESADETTAAGLMATYPALIKRPVFEADGRVIVGFKDEQQRLLEDL